MILIIYFSEEFGSEGNPSTSYHLFRNEVDAAIWKENWNKQYASFEKSEEDKNKYFIDDLCHWLEESEIEFETNIE